MESNRSGSALTPSSLVVPVPDVAEVHWIRGDAASPDARPNLLIEVAHGATATADFESLAALLDGPLPADLIEFFHVNTDSGAFELAQAVAAERVRAAPTHTVLIVRCRVPRTFVDSNRYLGATEADFKAGGVAPGLPPWIVSTRDEALLRARHAAYVATVYAGMATLDRDGAMLLMHTFAPRQVDVTVTVDIVPKLRAAYVPEVFETWAVRPELDVIGRGIDGVQYAPEPFVAALRAACETQGLALGDSWTYRLHPSTMGWHYTERLPGRTVCLEVRRDLVSPDGVFVPFCEVEVDVARVEALASPIAAALGALWDVPT